MACRSYVPCLLFYPSFLGFHLFYLSHLLTYFFWMRFLKIFSYTFSIVSHLAYVHVHNILGSHSDNFISSNNSMPVFSANLFRLFIYKRAIPKIFFSLSKIKTMICFLFIYILFLHASHFDWSMSRICQNHYYNDRDSYIFRKISAKICKIYPQTNILVPITTTLVCAQSHIQIVLRPVSNQVQKNNFKEVPH